MGETPCLARSLQERPKRERDVKNIRLGSREKTRGENSVGINEVGDLLVHKPVLLEVFGVQDSPLQEKVSEREKDVGQDHMGLFINSGPCWLTL